MILAIDTSTVQASVALADGGELLAELSWAAGRNHSQGLTAAIRSSLTLAEREIRNVSAVAVARGPGSFNGLRVGISEAKGIALGLSVPLIGVGSLDVVAFAESAPGRRVVAVMDAGRGEYYAAAFSNANGELSRESEYCRLPISEIVSLCRGEDLIAGPAAEAVAMAARTAGIEVVCHPAVGRWRRAGYLAELGRRALEANGQEALKAVRPLYLRRSSAEESREAATRSGV